ncbi:MAG: hypothetical protein ACTJG2_03245 [Candidatus Saccharimonadales bacterium]
MSPKKFIHFEPQPDFPSYDMSDQNAALSLHYLATQPEAEMHHDELKESLQLMHEIGNAALVEAKVETGNTKGEYDAFCRGFADIDYLALLLQSRAYTTLQRGDSMNFFYLRHGDMADYELARRRYPWIAEHPNMMEVIHQRSEAQQETPRQLAARAIGAQMASELLYLE